MGGRQLTAQMSPFTMTKVPESICNFLVGQPSKALIPRGILDQAFRDTINANTDAYIYQYPTLVGPLHVRQTLADYLTSSGRYPRIGPENICLTFGNSHGITLAIKHLTRPGDLVIVEDPTYFLVGQILRDAYVNVQMCPVHTENGLDLDLLENMVLQLKPALVYINPIHHNPTGTCLSVAKRRRLIQLSIDHDFYIVSDEPYVLLGFQEFDEKCSSLGASVSIADYSKLVCCGSFSKILTPGLRCGWISAHPSVIEKISFDGTLRSGGGPPSIIAQTISSLIESGLLKTHRAFLSQELAYRARRMMECIDGSILGKHATYHRPQGGYFLYLSFQDERFDTERFREFVNRKFPKVDFLPGAKCSVLPSTPSRGLRLSFSFYDADEIEYGISLLATRFKQFFQMHLTS